MYELNRIKSKRGNLFLATITRNNQKVFSYQGAIEDEEELEKLGKMIILAMSKGMKFHRTAKFCKKWRKWMERNAYLIDEPEKQELTIEDHIDISEQSILVNHIAQEMHQVLVERQHLSLMGQEAGQVTVLGYKAERLNNRLKVEQEKLSRMMTSRNVENIKKELTLPEQNL